MKITKSNLKQIIKEELKSVIAEKMPTKEELSERLRQDTRESLEKYYVQPLLDKGYRHAQAFPRLPGLKAGLKIKASYSGYKILLEGFDIELIMTQGIRGHKPFVWTVEEKEFKQLVGTNPGLGGLVYALLIK